jgi:aspartate aminotransferase-like enzyme
MLKIMTPGPTQIRENVRLARSREITNPDLDNQFFDFYQDTCCLLGRLIGTADPVYILSGEGILALEAACASLTEWGDKVLVLNNGVFGEGFADFVRIYGGEPVLYNADFRQEINIDKLSEFLKANHDFKYATLVHCDTPSGVLNQVCPICSLLKEYGILTVVDAVASMFGEELKVDESHIDIVCGGSQKVLSAPPGICFVSVSNEALTCMKKRKTPIASYYGNLLNFDEYYEKQWFPYTMPVSDIYGVSEALHNIAEDDKIIERHKIIAEGVRHAVRQSGLSLYIAKGFSNTVTAIEVPEGIKTEMVLNRMKEKYHILIAGSIGAMSGKVIRIGHMGENANYEDVAKTLKALTAVFLELGVPIKTNLEEDFLEYVNL